MWLLAIVKIFGRIRNQKNQNRDKSTDAEAIALYSNIEATTKIVN